MNSHFDTHNALESFRIFLKSKDHPYDGELTIDSQKSFERFPCSFAKAKNKHVSYFIRTDKSTGRLYGYFKCHSGICGISYNWTENNPNKDYENLTQEELNIKIREFLDDQRIHQGDLLTKEAKHADSAQAKWEQAVTKGIEKNPYVSNKQFLPYGLKKWGDTLYIPLHDITGKLWNIEQVYPSHEKRPLSGCRVNALFHLIGEVEPQGLIQLAEGIATACIIYEATQITTACCRNANNLIKVARAIKLAYPGIKLLICADDDVFKLKQAQTVARKKGEKIPTRNAGLLAAISIANTCGAEITKPDFSVIGKDEHFLTLQNPPSDFHDIFFWLLKQGKNRDDALAEVRRQILLKPNGINIMPHSNKTQHQDNLWDEPLPLIAKIESLPYPSDALPKIIKDAVDEVHSFTKAPYSLIASSGLASISLAAQIHANVKRSEKLTSPISLFFLTIADSGERKSTCDNFFTEEIKQYEIQQIELSKPILKQYDADMGIWEGKKSGFKEKLKNICKNNNPDTACVEQILEDLENERPLQPKIPRLLYTDATPEGLVKGLQVWPSAGIISAEAGAVFGAHGMNKDSIMRNLSQQNILWDGGTIKYDRSTSERISIIGRLTQYLQVQEATINEFLEKSENLARGTGYLARFLISCPPSTQGTRFFTEAPTNWPALSAYNLQIRKILYKTVNLEPNGNINYTVLNLSEEAKKVWKIFHDDIEKELADGGELRDVRDVASKAADNATRLAALFHIFNDDTGTDITLESFVAASRIISWHLNEARRFFGEIALPIEVTNTAKLSQWIVNYCRRHNITYIKRRELQRLITPTRLRFKKELDRAISELINLNHIKISEIKQSKIINVNPALLEEGQI